ncbi:MAG: hypothetical protein ABID54_07070 [Pseudomonadota bacterium]
MQQVGELLKGLNEDDELYDFLKKIPQDEDLTLDNILRVINQGAGGLSETEAVFLFLEAIYKRAKGEHEW